MAGWTVVLRGIRYRAGRSLMVLLLAAIATAATVLAPAYSRAAQQSVLSDRLVAAPLTGTSLQVRADALAGEVPALESTSEGKLELRLLVARRPSLARLLGQPVGGADLEAVASLGGAGQDPALTRLAYRDGACAHLRVSAGTCPRDAGAVLVSVRSAREYGVKVGSSLTLRGRGLVGAAATDPSKARTLTVAGLYTPSDASDPYWGRGGYFAAGAPDAESSLPRIDAVFVADEQDLTLPGSLPSVHLDYRLRTDAVRLDDVDQLRSDLSGFETDVNAGEMQLATGLRGVLDDIEAEASALGRTVPIIAVPLVLVCWFILFLLVAALTDERGGEVGLAKLRGFSVGQAARFGRAEAVVLVVLAAPLGMLAGLGLVQAAAASMFGEGVRVELRWPVFAAAGVAVLAALLAIRLASSRSLARPVLDLLRKVPARGRWRAGVAEGAVVALAAASLVAAVSDQTAPLALLAPGLLAVVAGIVTARLLGLWSRTRVRRHARRGRVSGVLAHAQLSRRHLGQRVMVVVTVAVALLFFAATAWDVAAQARESVASDTVGADRVFLVEAPDPVAFMAAVDAANTVDPFTAMPVVRVSERYGDGVVEVLGVRSDRFADVAVWRGHSRSEVAELVERLRPQQSAALAVRDLVELDVTASGLVGSPRLAAVVAKAGDPARTITLGPLAEGRKRYRAALTGCDQGCQVVGLAVTRAPASDGLSAADLSVHAISSAAGALPAGFGTTGRWRANAGRAPQATVTVQAGTALSVEVRTTDSNDVVISYVDTPDVLPVALVGRTPADDPAAAEFTFPALAESPQRFSVVERPDRLPRVSGDALLFDLDYAVRSAQRTSSLSDNSRLRYEVWATGAAPKDLASQLAAAGLQVYGEQSITAERDRLARGAPALGLRLYLLAGAAALVLAVGAVLLSSAVGASTRRYELAALRVAGVRAKVLRRGLLREYVHLMVLPLVVGVLVGMAGAVLMLPGIPLVTVGTPIGQLRYTPGPGALPIALAAMVVGLLIAVLAGLRHVGRATPDRLREGGVG
ncbi:MAG TPA: FtsX-like permease family protein [Micromonosporaceae bacterium]